MTYSMTWADFYLICFAIGFCFSFFSFLFGGSRTGRLHLPHFHGHVNVQLASASLAAPHGPVAGSHVPLAHGPAPALAHAANHDVRSSVSPFNPPSLAAFLAWFGGTGYLLTRFSSVWVGLGLLLSVASGLIGGGVIFLFLSRVLISDEENMDAADYEMVGVLGRVSSSVREGGTGEMVYTQMRTRRVCGARSDNGQAIAKGTEVVVTRYEKGIAYVRLWSELSDDQ
jgi:membrane protein implicated in regulation of membrane protease activity